ncbi:MAG: cytochrome B [Sulfitobacter sp.]|nr:cytochrome B [Sulfitobacter sp.]
MPFLTLTAFALVGCEKSVSTLHPAGPAAAAISTLWWVMLAGSGLILLLVLALLTAAIRRGEGAPSLRGFIWGLGLAFPMLTLAALLAYGLWTGERFLPRPDTQVVTVQAEARQWSWSFGYDDLPGRITQGILHIPAGRPVDVEITSGDVVHSFWVPRLAGKLDAVPGHVNRLRIEAWEPGEYAGLGSEFNGIGYGGHGFTVLAHDVEGWAAFLRGEEK